jgi:hypothetical protein
VSPPVSQPTPPPVTAASAPELQQAFAGSIPPSYAPTPYPPENSYPVSVAAVTEPPPRRRASYYVLLSIAALALFAISMFVTVLLLS